MKRLYILAALALVGLSSCVKEKIYFCQTQSFNMEAPDWYTRSEFQFVGTDAEKKQLEDKLTIGTPGVGIWQWCHCQ